MKFKFNFVTCTGTVIEGIKKKIRERYEASLEVINVSGKGRGVFTQCNLKSGDYICEYLGKLISFGEAKTREKAYSSQESIGCFMYYFKYKEHVLW